LFSHTITNFFITNYSAQVIETETVSAAKLAGKVKGVVNDKALGELTVEAETNGQLSTKAKLTELAKDVVVNLEYLFV
jgi:hypothetical protein